MKFQKIVTEINNAFFRLESFMNGTIMDYQYFGFKEAFINLFTEARKHENFNYDNCKLIGKYWQLTEQIRIDTDKGDYENCEIAIDNKMFCKDCNEILYLNWERIEDFEEFLTPDEITESERKYSITDILKAPVLPPPPKEKTLSELITDQNSVEIVEGIKIQYKNIKGKRLKLLLLALQELNLLPKERIAQKFYNCCKAEFGWNVASYPAMNDYQFNDRTDQFELNEMKQYLETKIKAK